MANTIKIKQSSVALKVPLAGDLQQGELALNTLDEKLYTKNSSGVVVELGGNASLPAQTGNSGKYLGTDGTDATWSEVDGLPSQTGHTGEFLTTDGTDASWTTSSSVSGIDNSVEYIVTIQGQTSFAAVYDVGHLNVFLNGLKLDTGDYTATDGANVVFTAGVDLNDSVYIQSFSEFVLVDHYTKVATDALLDAKEALGDSVAMAIALG